MNLAMYTAASGAKSQQDRLNVVSNNLANIQTDGYKNLKGGFVELLYENYERGVTNDPNTGAGTRLEKTDISFTPGALLPTDGKWDYAIIDDGLFALYDLGTEQVHYTRNGNFRLSNFGDDVFYLAAQDGSLVMDKNMGLIPIIGGITSEEEPQVGVFDFVHKEGFTAVGGNRYVPGEQSGDPYVKEDAIVVRGKLEGSNVDFAEEMTRVVESQRAYQMALKMIQTADEVEQTINSLR